MSLKRLIVPAMLGEDGDVSVRLGGASCLSGDIIGDYNFAAAPKAVSASPFWIRRIIQWSKPRL